MKKLAGAIIFTLFSSAASADHSMYIGMVDGKIVQLYQTPSKKCEGADQYFGIGTGDKYNSYRLRGNDFCNDKSLDEFVYLIRDWTDEEWKLAQEEKAAPGEPNRCGYNVVIPGGWSRPCTEKEIKEAQDLYKQTLDKLK